MRERQYQEDESGNKNGAQSSLPRHTHAQYHGKRVKGDQTNARRQTNRVIYEQSHRDRNDARRETSRDQHRVFIHPRRTHDARCDKQDVRHGDERRNPRHDLRLDIRIALFQRK